MSATRPSYFGVGSIANYSGLDQVGEGTYGYVYKARDKRTGEAVALKRLLFHKENLGFPLNAVRELKFLKCLQHKNVVQLKDVVTSKGCEAMEKEVKTDSNRSDDKISAKDQERHGNSVLSLCGNLYLVFEFVDHDLGGLLDAKYKFSIREVKCIAKQLFEVLEFLSEKKILHRDIKSSNILITNRHQVKLADFGLARSIMSADGRDLRLDLTNNVVTMWYKAPELLLGAVRYAHAVDVWSVGCVLAELELGRPLFPGRTDLEQMDLVCRTLGTPTEDTWTGLQKMPAYAAILPALSGYSTTLRGSLGGRLSDGILDLLERILVFDPARRGSAKILLTNKYFNTQPLPPIDPADLEPMNITAGVSYHEYRTKQQKRQREQDTTSNSKGGEAAVPAAQSSSGSAENGASAPAPSAPVPRPPPPPGPPGGTAAGGSAADGVAAATSAHMGYGAPILPAALAFPPGTAYAQPAQSAAAAYQYPPTSGYGAPIAPPPMPPAVQSAYGAPIQGAMPAAPTAVSALSGQSSRPAQRSRFGDAEVPVPPKAHPSAQLSSLAFYGPGAGNQEHQQYKQSGGVPGYAQNNGYGPSMVPPVPQLGVYGPTGERGPPGLTYGPGQGYGQGQGRGYGPGQMHHQHHHNQQHQQQQQHYGPGAGRGMGPGRGGWGQQPNRPPWGSS